MDKIVKALIAGAEYYGVAYPCGVCVMEDAGTFFAYDHLNRIVASNSSRIALEKIINRAKIKASKELDE